MMRHIRAKPGIFLTHNLDQAATRRPTVLCAIVILYVIAKTSHGTPPLLTLVEALRDFCGKHRLQSLGAERHVIFSGPPND